MRFELEKGSKKYVCPACSQKRFVRYVKQSTKEHLDSDVGRCDRESSCGYHFTPKMYFAENPNLRNRQNERNKIKRITQQGAGTKNGGQAQQPAQDSSKRFDLIPVDYLLGTLGNYSQNAFVRFLLNLFPDCSAEINKAVNDYRIGTTKTGRTVFWQIDKNNRIRTGKIIAYDAATGKRIKSINPNWTHAELKKRNLLAQDFNLKQCFFGEHLLRNNSDKATYIVEAEKTAVIASICHPENVWLAIGSKQSLKFDRLKQIGRNRKIIL